jgi:tetratricopeptide (TPR) repeat protein
MPPAREQADRKRPGWDRAAPLVLVLLAFLVCRPGLGNRFVQDELPLLLMNDAVHTLEAPQVFFTTPYWHDPFPPALYRPLATASLAVQWSAGQGSPVTYRWVSAGLLALAAIALFRLARLLLPSGPALAAAGLFLVHPVHVEAIALGVNQGEILVALLSSLAVLWYLERRRHGTLGLGAAAGIAALYLLAVLFKENGLVLPLFLLAAEAVLVTDPRPRAARLASLRPFYLGLGLVAAVFLAIRTAVLGGDVAGTFAAGALTGAGATGRALTMLGVVPEWVRLLFWPSELQADYGLREIVPAAAMAGRQWLGLALIAGWAALLWVVRRRLPVAAFALLWIPIALLPVSNLLIPTGVVLAERTLFLATAGAALLVGAMLAQIWVAGRRPVPAMAAGIIVVALLALGLARSRERLTVWRNQETLLRQTVVDAPKSFAAHLALARFLEDSGRAAEATQAYRRAVAIMPAQIEQDRLLAEQNRLAGRCRPARRLYRRVLSIAPDDSAMLAGLAACTDSVAPVPLRTGNP